MTAEIEISEEFLERCGTGTLVGTMMQQRTGELKKSLAKLKAEARNQAAQANVRRHHQGKCGEWCGICRASQIAIRLAKVERAKP